VLLTSLYTWLPQYMVSHFDVRSLERPHAAQLATVAPFLLPIGFAAQVFLFAPSLAAKKGVERVKRKAFNPETATLGETLRWNLGLDKLITDERLSVLLERTAILALFGGVDLAVKSLFSVQGADIKGVAGWAAIWSGSATVVGGIFAWVGNV
jgi:hypothetical protein